MTEFFGFDTVSLNASDAAAFDQAFYPLQRVIRGATLMSVRSIVWDPLKHPPVLIANIDHFEFWPIFTAISRRLESLSSPLSPICIHVAASCAHDLASGRLLELCGTYGC